MQNRVLFVEGYHAIPSKIQQLLEAGWDVFNAPRPLPGAAAWQGDFRHGIFYATIAPEGDPVDEFNDRAYQLRRCRELDGHPIEIVSRETIESYRVKLEKRYGDLSAFEYANVVDSYLSWRDREEE